MLQLQHDSMTLTLQEAVARLQPLLNRMLVVRSLMLGQLPPVLQLPARTPGTAYTCRSNVREAMSAWDRLRLPPPRQMLVLLGTANPERRHILLHRWTSHCEPRRARHLHLAGQQLRLLELPEKYQVCARSPPNEPELLGLLEGRMHVAQLQPQLLTLPHQAQVRDWSDLANLSM